MCRMQRRKGATFVACMIFLVVFLAFGAALASFSGANTQMAANQRRAGRALAGAESGIELMRYWLGHVMLDVTVTGACQQIERTIHVGFRIAPYEHPIFKYGLATKGPIQFPNNPTTDTVTSHWEADMYTESSNSTVALYVGGNTNFDGDISIANPNAMVDFVGDVIIAGDTGQTAIDNHVSIGVEPVDFRAADTSRFLPYATGPVVDPCTMDLTKGLTLINATINGSLISFADSPTVVEGNVSLTFDRADSVKIPAGFDTKRVLAYDPTSYAMVY